MSFPLNREKNKTVKTEHRFWFCFLSRNDMERMKKSKRAFLRTKKSAERTNEPPVNVIAQEPSINISVSVLFTSLCNFIALFSRFLFKNLLMSPTSVRYSGICGFVCGMFEMKEARKKKYAKKLCTHRGIGRSLDISEYWIYGYGCANFVSLFSLQSSFLLCDLHSAVIIRLCNRSMLHITIDTIQWIIIIKQGRLLNLLHRLFLCTFLLTAPVFVRARHVPCAIVHNKKHSG